MHAEVWWLSWQALLSLGIAIIVVVALRPKTFWPILILGNMVGNGPRTYTYFFLDEIVTACALVGAFLAITVGRHARPATPARQRAASLHHVFFLVWAGYMVILSIVGIGMSDDIRVIRWAFFYVMLTICLVTVAREDRFQFPEPRRAWRLILIGAIAAFGSYVVQGIYTEGALGGVAWSRFDSQDYLWAGSAYATFPIVLGMPAALLFLRDRSIGMKSLAWTALALYMTVGFYFLSRITWLVMAAFIATNPERVGIRRGATLTASFLVLFMIVGPAEFAYLKPFVTELADSRRALTDPDDSDVTRNLQIRAAFATISENWVTAVTGSGIYTNRYRIAPHIDYLQATYLDLQYRKYSINANRPTGPSDTEQGRPVYRTTGFPALLIDTGVFGIFLFVANFIFTGVTVLHSRSPDKRLLMLTLPIVCLWLLVANTTDVILQYLMIMPGGLLVHLSESPRRYELNSRLPLDQRYAAFPQSLGLDGSSAIRQS